MNHAQCWIGSLLLLCCSAGHAAPGEAPESSWLAEAQRELVQREYRASSNEVGLQAPNRAQGFRTYFDGHGIQLVARSAGNAPLAALALAGVGRDQGDRAQHFRALGLAKLSPDAAQVTLRWPAISARYDNRSDGLHQAITLDRRPSGSGRLSVALDITAAELQLGTGVALLRSAGATLRLGSLTAQDARGRALPVTLEAEAGSLRLSIDDRHAKYPIAVKSVISGSINGLLESNQGNSNLGTSVSGAGDVNGDGFADVIVGANRYDNGQAAEGAAFIYFGGAGGFDITADALLESNQASAQLGYSVAGAGDVNGDGFADVIVGGYQYDNGDTDEGAAFVWFGGAGAFNLSHDAQLETHQAGALLGSSVAGAGDVNGDGFADVIVGALLYENGQVDEGAAFVYFGGAGVFDATADAQLETNQANALLGTAVAGAGDVNGDGFADVILGASSYDNGQADEGAAFVYFGSAGPFNLNPDAQLESNQASARMGFSVGGAGDVNGDGFADVIVGADLYDNGQAEEGAAFVYFGSTGVFNATPDTFLEPNVANAQLGHSVAGAGDVNGDGFADVIVGARRYVDGEFNEGAAFVYFGGAGTFNADVDALLQLNSAMAEMGVSVAGAGDVNGDGFADVIVGANGYTSGEAFEGAAVVYFGSAGIFNLASDGQLLPGQADAGMGSSVAGAGDVNGDGFDDVIVGAPLYDSGQADAGAAFLYFGGAGTFDSTFDARLELSTGGDARLGSSVAGAGDVNGDGFADVIVGAPRYANGQALEGAAFIYFGGAGAFDGAFDAQLQADQENAFMGSAASGIGDVNGDGFADVIAQSGGSAWIYFGSAGAFDQNRDAVLTPGVFSAISSVAGAGDVNGDGYADVVLGDPFADAAYLYFGGPGPFDVSADAQIDLGNQLDEFGGSVAGAGDVNGDGFDDVIVGAKEFDGTSPAGGAVFLYLGGPGAFNFVYDALLYGDAAMRLGGSVAGAGDVNGDGFADLIAGAHLYDNPESNEGAAYVYYGGPMPLDIAFDARMEPDVALANMGTSVAGVGDVNGDGFADVVVGAPGATNRADVFLGTNRGRPVLASQYRGDGTSPVQRWGLSQQADGFVVSLQATSPRGRERVRLQLEACPNGAPFGSLLCDIRTATTWTELGANPLGSTLVLPATGLNVNRLYHWRARVQYAPLSVTAPGIVSPLSPAAGPWRRLQANAGVADIRTRAPLTSLVFANGFE